MPMSNGFLKKIAYTIRYHIFSVNGLGLIKYYPIHKVVYFFWSHFIPEFILTDDHKIYLDSKDSLGLAINPNHEYEETIMIKQQIKKGNNVIDIGANIGYFTLLFAKLVGPDGKVFAFEPDPTNFSILKKNIEVNNYNNVILSQKAISDKTEPTKLFLCKFSNGMHRTYDSNLCDKSLDIESVTLDDFLNQINFSGKIDFIKIDTEGSEIKVLKGIEKIIEMNDDISLQIEFNPSSINECGFKSRSLPDFLIKKGFQMLSFSHKIGKFKIISLTELLDRYPDKKSTFVNLFCKKNSNFN